MSNFFAVANLKNGIIYGVSDESPSDALLDSIKNGGYNGTINNTSDIEYYGERLVEISQHLYESVMRYGGDVGFLIHRVNYDLSQGLKLISTDFTKV